MLVGREVVLGGGQRCGNSIHISDPEYDRASGRAGQEECHLGPIREGCLGEEASEQDREKRVRSWGTHHRSFQKGRGGACRCYTEVSGAPRGMCVHISGRGYLI